MRIDKEKKLYCVIIFDIKDCIYLIEDIFDKKIVHIINVDIRTSNDLTTLETILLKINNQKKETIIFDIKTCINNAFIKNRSRTTYNSLRHIIKYLVSNLDKIEYVFKEIDTNDFFEKIVKENRVEKIYVTNDSELTSNQNLMNFNLNTPAFVNFLEKLLA